MAVIRRISSKTLADILLLHPQPRLSSCVFAVNKQNFSKGSFDFKGKTSLVHFFSYLICDENLSSYVFSSDSMSSNGL